MKARKSSQRIYHHAIADYSTAIDLDSEDGNAYYHRGNAFNFLQEYKQAIMDYDWCIALEPNHYNAYYNRAITYSCLELYHHAIADYNQASVCSNL